MVCLYLPRHLGEATEAEAPRFSRSPQRAEADATVLVVDDEVMVRMLVTEVLEDQAIDSIEAEDGPSGAADPGFQTGRSIC